MTAAVGEERRCAAHPAPHTAVEVGADSVEVHTVLKLGGEGLCVEADLDGVALEVLGLQGLLALEE